MNFIKNKLEDEQQIHFYCNENLTEFSLNRFNRLKEIHDLDGDICSFGLFSNKDKDEVFVAIYKEGSQWKHYLYTASKAQDILDYLEDKLKICDRMLLEETITKDTHTVFTNQIVLFGNAVVQLVKKRELDHAIKN